MLNETEKIYFRITDHPCFLKSQLMFEIYSCYFKLHLCIKNIQSIPFVRKQTNDQFIKYLRCFCVELYYLIRMLFVSQRSILPQVPKSFIDQLSTITSDMLKRTNLAVWALSVFLGIYKAVACFILFSLLSNTHVTCDGMLGKHPKHLPIQSWFKE